MLNDFLVTIINVLAASLLTKIISNYNDILIRFNQAV